MRLPFSVIHLSLPLPLALFSGDPNSLHLRHVETDILIPKIAKQIATEKCSDLVAGQRFALSSGFNTLPDLQHLRQIFF